MALRNNISIQKQHGVVYTPRWIVDFILANTLGSCGLFGKKICDPACGDGNFLAAVVENMIAAGKKRGQLLNALQNDIYGFDVDKAALSHCRKRLDDILAAHEPNMKIKWNLHCLDSADKRRLACYAGFFDFIVGNPPYIRIQHLAKEMRVRIVRQWPLAARGCSDIYMAFFEAGLFLLNNTGKLGYITPNGYAKTDAGRPLRKFLADNSMVRILVDFGEHQIFAAATTYTMITVLHKEGSAAAINLRHYDGVKIGRNKTISGAQLSAAPWDLCAQNVYKKVRQLRTRGVPLCEIANINVGVQTLADDVFILEQTGETATCVVGKTAAGELVELEKEGTLPILKVSVMKNGQDRKMRVIICPYQKDTLHKPVLMSETQLQIRCPKIYAYLCVHKKRLLQRDKGMFCRARWYAFGREINLQKTLGEKILTSGMNKSPNFMKCPDPQYTFYSGYSVKIKNRAIGMDALLAQLNSAEMDFFIRHTSRDYQNGWKSYAKTFIQHFGVVGAETLLGTDAA